MCLYDHNFVKLEHNCFDLIVFPERIVAQNFESTHKKEIKPLTQTVVFILRIRNIGKNEIIVWSVLSGVLLLGLPQSRDSELLLNLSQSIHLK